MLLELLIALPTLLVNLEGEGARCDQKCSRRVWESNAVRALWTLAAKEADKSHLAERAVRDSLIEFQFEAEFLLRRFALKEFGQHQEPFRVLENVEEHVCLGVHLKWFMPYTPFSALSIDRQDVTVRSLASSPPAETGTFDVGSETGGRNA
jgi:hypothetical protein